MSSHQSSSSSSHHHKSDHQQKKDQHKAEHHKAEHHKDERKHKDEQKHKDDQKNKEEHKHKSEQKSSKSEPQQQQQSSQVSSATSSSSASSSSSSNKDFYRKKIHFYFTEILDLNSDGYFDSHDIESCKEVYKHVRKVKTDSAEFEKFSKFLNKWLNVIKELTQRERAYREQWLAAAIEAHQKEMEKKAKEAKEAAAANASKDKDSKEKESKEKKEDKEKLKQLEEQQKPKIDPNLITIDDFIKFMEYIRSKFENKKQFPKSLSYMEDYAEALFNLMDLDRDGYLTKKDFLAEYLNAEDLKSREKAWSLITEKDESKKFDRKQFEELVVEFLVSASPKDRGNWIFGYFD